MSLGFEKCLASARGDPGRRQAEEAEPRLNIDVIFTSVRQTLAALKRAGELATRLNARITLVVTQVVPYPAPLESPPVLLEFNENRFRVIARDSPVETTVSIYLCRDRWGVLRQILKPGSLVVLAGRKRWWPTEESRIAGKLRRGGHEVIYTTAE